MSNVTLFQQNGRYFQRCKSLTTGRTVNVGLHAHEAQKLIQQGAHVEAPKPPRGLVAQSERASASKHAAPVAQQQQRSTVTTSTPPRPTVPPVLPRGEHRPSPEPSRAPRGLTSRAERERLGIVHPGNPDHNYNG